MSKTTRLLIGAITILPFLYMLSLVALIPIAMLVFGYGAWAEVLRPLLMFGRPIQILVVVLMVFYIVNVFRNDSVEKGNKVSWVVVLFLLNFFVIPIYWYLYIWRAIPTVEGRDGLVQEGER